MTGELASQFAPGPSIQDASNITRGPFSQKPSESKSSVAGLEKLLEDAEYLLDYAAESGIALEPEMVETIVAAEAAEKLSPEDTVKAIAAITSLSAKLQPVSAKTLRACQDDANRTVKKYRRIAIALGVFLLVSSIVSFMTSRLSTACRDRERARDHAQRDRDVSRERHAGGCGRDECGYAEHDQSAAVPCDDQGYAESVAPTERLRYGA